MVYSCCGDSFPDWGLLMQHINSTPAHTTCSRCRRGFVEEKSFIQHIRHSLQHAPNASTGSTVALVPRVSLEANGYKGVPSSQVKLVFQTACKLKRSGPTPEDVIRATGTALSVDVVSAILEGALRLLPVDRSPQGDADRRAKMALKAAHAAAAERAFVDVVRSLNHRLKDEEQQKREINDALERDIAGVIRFTPDIRFVAPTLLCGKACSWVEYKNSFGFKKNPMIHSKHVKQLRRYRSEFGEGMIVYKLGYEQDLFDIDGVSCYREAEVRLWAHTQQDGGW